MDSDTDQDELVSTYCGSMTREELREHVKECEVCAGDEWLMLEVADDEEED